MRIDELVIEEIANIRLPDGWSWYQEPYTGLKIFTEYGPAGTKTGNCVAYAVQCSARRDWPMFGFQFQDIQSLQSQVEKFNPQEEERKWHSRISA